MAGFNSLAGDLEIDEDTMAQLKHATVTVDEGTDTIYINQGTGNYYAYTIKVERNGFTISVAYVKDGNRADAQIGTACISRSSLRIDPL